MSGAERRVALVTCRVLPEPDPDQEPLLAALRDAGLAAELLPWDDERADPGAYDLCVLRSCWNYYRDPEAFLAWVARADGCTRLANPAKVLRWNLHKEYLRELESWGVPIVPTAWAERGERLDLRALLEARGWRSVVIKPTISAASYRTARFDADRLEEGQAFLDALLADRGAMVQPYLSSVESGGERALVCIDGVFTHAVRKSPRFGGEHERVSEALPIEDAELALAERTLAHVSDGLLYARVDVMLDERGEPLVSEVELAEPSLFLVQCPEALARLVDGIVRRVR